MHDRLFFFPVKFSLSTNWCNRTLETGEEIADKAISLGFDELELGFHTTAAQVEGFRRRLGEIPVGSVHAFCPVPLSAPQGYPELYQLASFDEETRKMAHLQITRNIRFAADIGADCLVLHLGRVMCRGLFRRFDMKRRVKRGAKMVDVAKRELDALVPELEKCKVVLGLENLPYLEGFPAEWEVEALCGEWVRPWFDTGHDFVRIANGWKSVAAPAPVGLHVNDSLGDDDHLAPGAGKVDFESLKSLAEGARHVVFEPNQSVGEGELRAALEFLRRKWGCEQ